MHLAVGEDDEGLGAGRGHERRPETDREPQRSPSATHAPPPRCRRSLAWEPRQGERGERSRRTPSGEAPIEWARETSDPPPWRHRRGEAG
jgi:hypothetical protein